MRAESNRPEPAGSPGGDKTRELNADEGVGDTGESGEPAKDRRGLYVVPRGHSLKGGGGRVLEPISNEAFCRKRTMTEKRTQNWKRK